MNLPVDFTNRMKNILGNEYEAFIASFDMPNVKAFHINTKRISKDQISKLIDNTLSSNLNDISSISQVKDYNSYIYEGKIGRCPASHAGLFYSQDPSAMLPVVDIPFEVTGNEKILDLCAAPGGKTSQLSMLGKVLSNEVVPSRNKILISNIERMGYLSNLVTKAMPNELAAYYPSYFDIILVDAPCSGEGMFRKYPESVDEWSLDNVKLCADRQKDILSSAVTMLKPGGHLIYSTCTYAPEEDEDMVEFISSLGLSKLKIQDSYFVKCYPHVQQGEGQFYAYFERPASFDTTSFDTVYNPSQDKSLKKPSNKTLDIIRKTLKDSVDITNLNIYESAGNLITIPDDYIKLPPHGITKAGIILGNIEKDRFVPHHQFFHCLPHLFKIQVNFEEETEELYKYLHGEEIFVDGTPTGFGVITYLGAAIGGFKSVNGRLKNYYPKGLRNQ